MFETDDEKTLKELYRENLSQELSRPEIQQDKKIFLASFYAPAPRPSFSFISAGFSIPAFAILGIFLWFAHLQTYSSAVQGPAAPMNLVFRTIMEEAEAKKAEALAEAQLKARQAKAAFETEDPLYNHMRPRVEVKRIASRVGPTMVYQKAYREAPVTVIWVFTGGGQHS